MLNTFDSILLPCQCISLFLFLFHSWPGEVHFRHVKKIGLCFVSVAMSRLFTNSPKYLYFQKDNYQQKQSDTLPVTTVTEIMHFNSLLWWLPYGIGC